MNSCEGPRALGPHLKAALPSRNVCTCSTPKRLNPQGRGGVSRSTTPAALRVSSSCPVEGLVRICRQPFITSGQRVTQYHVPDAMRCDAMSPGARQTNYSKLVNIKGDWKAGERLSEPRYFGMQLGLVRTLRSIYI